MAAAIPSSSPPINVPQTNSPAASAVAATPAAAKVTYTIQELVAKTAKQLKRIEKRAQESGDVTLSELLIKARHIRQQKNSSEDANLSVAYKLYDDLLGEDGKINGTHNAVMDKLVHYTGGDVNKAADLALAGLVHATTHFTDNEWRFVQKKLNDKIHL